MPCKKIKLENADFDIPKDYKYEYEKRVYSNKRVYLDIGRGIKLAGFNIHDAVDVKVYNNCIVIKKAELGNVSNLKIVKCKKSGNGFEYPLLTLGLPFLEPLQIYGGSKVKIKVYNKMVVITKVVE